MSLSNGEDDEAKVSNTAAKGSSPAGSEAAETDAEYESDFEVDKEPITRADDEDEEANEYDNDSFIIDDDGANKEGDLTASTEGKVSKGWIY